MVVDYRQKQSTEISFLLHNYSRSFHYDSKVSTESTKKKILALENYHQICVITFTIISLISQHVFLSLCLSFSHTLSLSLCRFVETKKKREDKIGFGGLAVFDKANVAVTKKKREKKHTK